MLGVDDIVDMMEQQQLPIKWDQRGEETYPTRVSYWLFCLEHKPHMAGYDNNW